MNNIFGKIGIGFASICLISSIISSHAYQQYDSGEWFAIEYIDEWFGNEQSDLMSIPEFHQDRYSLFKINEWNAIVWGYIISMFCAIIGLLATLYAESENENTLFSANSFIFCGIGIIILHRFYGALIVFIFFSYIIYKRRMKGIKI